MNLPHASDNDFFAEAYVGNKCILSGDADYLDIGGDCKADSSLANRLLLGNNTIYTPTASPSIRCGKTYTFAQWSALGLDAGTTVAKLPTAQEIIGWARSLLQME